MSFRPYGPSLSRLLFLLLCTLLTWNVRVDSSSEIEREPVNDRISDNTPDTHNSIHNQTIVRPVRPPPAIVHTNRRGGRALRQHPIDQIQITNNDATKSDGGTIPAEIPDDTMHMHMNSDVAVHLSSNDTCTLSSQPNGTELLLTCPGCRLSVPLSQANFDVELFFSKAVNYAYFVSALTVVQIYYTFKQMKSTEPSAAAGRICRYSVGMQGLLDGYQSMFHAWIALSCDALANAFTVTAILQFVLCVLFNQNFLVHLYRMAYPSEFDSWERQQQARKWLYFKFYSWMTLGLIAIWGIPNGTQLVPFLLYGFWIPQIAWQAVHGFRRGFNVKYIGSMSITRLVLPAYYLMCPVNFLNYETNSTQMIGLALWMGVQLTMLFAQKKLGARFFVPRKFLPVPYDYHRDTTFLQSLRRRTGASVPTARTEPAATVAHEDVAVHVQERQGLLQEAAKEREEIELSSVTPHRIDVAPVNADTPANGAATSSSVPGPTVPATPTTDDDPCPICYTELDVSDPSSIMVCPCDHLFHTQCLLRWMKQKFECPVCRASLPVIEKPTEEASSEDDDEPEEEPEDEEEEVGLEVPPQHI